MIEDVEELASEVQAHFLGYVKLTLQSDVGLPRAEAAQHIASEITLLSGRQVKILQERGISRVAVQLVLVSPGAPPKWPIEWSKEFDLGFTVVTALFYRQN
jgi:hypothetical protein